MSLLRRVRRALETRSCLQLDDRSVFGALAEAYVDQLLDDPTIKRKVLHPIIPPSAQRPYPLESDVLVSSHELFDFFREHADAHFAQHPSPWVTQGKQRVPTTNLILTTDEQPFKGSLIGHTLTCKTTAGAIMQVPYKAARSIWFEHDGLFSDYDRITVYDTHGPCPSAPGCLPQPGSYPHSSLQLRSNRCFSSLLFLSSPQSFRSLVFQCLPLQ